MKSKLLIKLLLYPCILLMVCFNSCQIDNFKAPDAQFFGSVIDDETNQPIQQDIINGSRIDYIELGFENPNIRQIVFQTDGTFRENNLFSGTYEVQALRGNFIPSLIETIDIKGATEHHFRSLPYIRIHNVELTFDEIRGVVTSTFTLEQVSENPVESIQLIADRNPNVSNSFFEARASKDIGAVVNPDEKLKIELSTENLVSGKDYFFRVGALISGIAEAKHNYSETIRLHIDNSQVIPDAPIPGKVLDACESLTGWAVSAGGTLSLDDSDKKEGNYSIRITSGDGGGTFVFQKAFETPFDTEVTRANGYFAFDLYVSDVSLLSQNQLELTSSGRPDVEEVSWNNFGGFVLDNGWNRVELSLAHAPADVNLNAINFMRFYDLQNLEIQGNIVIKIDHIRFYSK